jgi:hypothetical protein
VGAEGEGTWRKSCSIDECGTGRGTRTWRGEVIWDETMGLYRKKYRETNRGMEILRTMETCILPQHKMIGEAATEVAISPRF